MTASRCAGRRVGRPFISRIAGAATLLMLLGNELSWAGPPNPTASDALGNTAGGSNALLRNITGPGNTAFGFQALHDGQQVAGAARQPVGLGDDQRVTLADEVERGV